MTTTDINWKFVKFVTRYYLEDTRIWSSCFLAHYNYRPVICFVHHNGDVWGLFALGHTEAQYIDNFNNQLEFCITNIKSADIIRSRLVNRSSNYSSLSETLKELERLSIVELL